MRKLARGNRRPRARGRLALAVSTGLVTTIFGSITASTAFAATSGGHAMPRGGSLTVTLTTYQWPGLDPATDAQDQADQPILNAIYGGLFEEGPNGSIIPDQATSYKWADHSLELDIFLRHGLTFQDGTPFNASAVASSIQRDLLPSNACICDANFSSVSSVTASGRYEVVLHLSKLDSPLLAAFIGAAPNWTISSSALAQKGESVFAQAPVGAGPFQVVSNLASSTIKLARFPHYWEKGHPYLDSLTFMNIGTDQSAYDALVSGEVQMNEKVQSTQSVQEAKTNSQLKVVSTPATLFQMVQLNENTPPFNNILAREAVEYATDSKSIVSALYQNVYKTIEGPTGAGELFYDKTIPGFRGYNLTKAKQLVQQLGGLSVSIETLTNTPTFENEAQAIATQWEAAGIQVTIRDTPLPVYIVSVGNKSFQAALINYGVVDPGLDLGAVFSTGGMLSGMSDPTLDGMLNQGIQYTNPATRAKVYLKIFERINSQADGVFEYAHGDVDIISKSLEGLNGHEPQVEWENLYFAK